MTERPLKTLGRIIKEADKLVQDVQKGVGKIAAGINELRELGGKSKGEQDK